MFVHWRVFSCHRFCWYLHISQGGSRHSERFRKKVPLRQHVVDVLETFLGGYCKSLIKKKSHNIRRYFHLYSPGASSTTSIPGCYVIISKLQTRVAELEEHAAKLKRQVRDNGITPFDSDQDTTSFLLICHSLP